MTEQPVDAPPAPTMADPRTVSHETALTHVIEDLASDVHQAVITNPNYSGLVEAVAADVFRALGVVI